MNDERELRIFRALIKQNLARIAERVAARWPRATAEQRTDRLDSYLWRAFQDRDMFDPVENAWITWFGFVMEWEDAADGYGEPPRWPGEDAVDEPPRRHSVHGPEFGEAVSGRTLLATPVDHPWHRSDIGLVNVQHLPHDATECPPCWRCRYFDGWLPKDEDEVAASSEAALEPEIAESCLRLDQNKVRIAKWVRGMGWEDLEDSE